jgi:hypothetical protein
VTGTITSVGTCPVRHNAFSSTWAATLGGTPYTLTVAVEGFQPYGVFDAGAANGYAARVTLARAGASTLYDSTALSSEEAGRITINIDEVSGRLDVRLQDSATRATVLATGTWTCKA